MGSVFYLKDQKQSILAWEEGGVSSYFKGALKTFSKNMRMKLKCFAHVKAGSDVGKHFSVTRASPLGFSVN